jgi:Tfp pilus assembly protein PilX
LPEVLSATLVAAASGNHGRLLVLGLIVVVMTLAIVGIVAARRRLREQRLARDAASSRPEDAT